MSRFFFFFLLFTCNLTVAQSQWQDGAFNTRTGQQITEEQWKVLLPQEFDLFQSDKILEIDGVNFFLKNCGKLL